MDNHNTDVSGWIKQMLLDASRGGRDYVATGDTKTSTASMVVAATDALLSDDTEPHMSHDDTCLAIQRGLLSGLISYPDDDTTPSECISRGYRLAEALDSGATDKEIAALGGITESDYVKMIKEASDEQE